jgi:glycolate oxidase iron-sulfur subunit
MAKNKRLEDFAEVIGQCVKCGVCQAHCPTYQAEKKEGAVARGKIALADALLRGETRLEQRLQDDISMCLMCGSCVTKCPNKVPTDQIVGAMRREITNSKGLSPLGVGVSTFLGAKGLMTAAGKTGALLSPLLLKTLPEKSGLRLRVPLPIMANRSFPKLPFRNLHDRVPEFVIGHPDKPLIGFFSGCALTYLYPQVGEIMVALLSYMGFSVYTPRSQRCCGIPAHSAGNGKLVEELAAANVDAFSRWEVAHIITACGSCNNGIGENYRAMGDDYLSFTDKVIDFSEFLNKYGLFAELAKMARWQKPLRVTYHDPCHLKSQGITKAPRELLRMLPNVEFIEMENADSCCGLGGTFSVLHYEQSKKIGAKKMAGLAASGADFVATGCPGCIIQLQDSINHAGLKVQAVHLLELVAGALKLPEVTEI